MGTFLSFRAYNTDNQLIIHSAAKFRFHKGTIKTGLILFLCYLILYFNSIKVQLKQPWQLLAPPSVVEELKQARAQRSAGGGGGLVGVVRVGCEIYTADTVQQLRAIVERLEREEATKR